MVNIRVWIRVFKHGNFQTFVKQTSPKNRNIKYINFATNITSTKSPKYLRTSKD